MKKIIVRIVIILFAASLVSAGWYAYDMTSSDQAITQDGRGDFTPDGVSEDGGRGGRPREGAEGGDESNSVSQLLSGTAVIVGQTALVVAVVALLRMLINRFVPKGYKKKIASSPS